jgi:hypothetical protein
MLEIPVNLKLEGNQALFVTDLINGNLNSFIIDTDNKIEVIIQSELGYLIFHRKEVFGNHCFSIRNRISTPVNKAEDILTFDKFLVNEKLNLIFIGPKDTLINSLIRIE